MKKTKINRLLKRTAAGILALAMISVPLPAQEMGLPDFSFGITVSADDYGFFGENNSLHWSYYESNGRLVIEDYASNSAAMDNWSKANDVPWNKYRQMIKSVRIENKVTSIGNYAFSNCPNITSVNMLTYLDNTSHLTSIGLSAFEGCTSLTSINIPNGVTSVGENAFKGCTGLTSIKLPDRVAYIGLSAFENCSNLESAYIPDTLTSTGVCTFYGCSSLKSINIPSNATFIGNFFLYGCSSLTSITIPEKVKSIGNSAFCNCSGLTSITIPNSVTSVGNYAFKNCSGLETIFIPSSLNVSNADIPSTASQIRYTIGEDGKATVTDVTLGTERTALTIPDKIGNASVAVVCVKDGTTGITCPSAAVITYSISDSKATVTKLVPPTGQTTADLPETINGYPIAAVAADYQQYVGTHTHNFDSNNICMLCSKAQYVKGITVSPDKQKLNVGGIVDLTADVDPDNAIDPSLTWTSSDTSVATVNENGTVKAVAPGTAVIRATANDGSGKYAECEITVELSTVISITETETGSEPVLSKDYTYDSINHVLTILSDKAMTISGTSTTDKIFVQKDISANITLNGVNIDVSGTMDACAFRIADNSTGDVTITLKGTNVLKSANNRAGIQKNGISNSIGKLEIKGDGSLKVSGVAFAAGIGGDTNGSCSKVTISGGTITAIGCKYGYAAGIGGGKRGSTSDIKITGGSVKASVGCIPTNGTENVYPLTISNPDNKPVTINGKDYTPVNHRELDENDGNLYVFLPARTAENPNFVKVGDTTTKYVYDTEASKWYKIVDTITISIDAPTAGQVLDTSALASAANYTLGAVSWTDGDTTARFDKEYTAEIVVTANSDCIFGGSLTATVNGETASITDNGDGTATVTYTFKKTGHSITKVNAVDSTCTTDGNTEHYKCSVCNKLFADESGTTETTIEDVTIPAAHKLSHIEAANASCTESGNIEHYKCDVCEKLFTDESGTTETTLEAVTISAIGHTITHIDANDPTCTEDGNIEHYKCDVCGKLFADDKAETEVTLKEVTITAAHKLSLVDEKAATCTEDGNIEHYKCSVCNKLFADENGETELTLKEVTITAAHKLSPVNEKAATCTEDGNIEHYKCDVCGKLFTDNEGKNETTLDAVTIPKGHKFGTAWESNTKEHYHECTVCHERSDIADHEKDSGTVTKEATPTEGGTIEYKCKVCGADMGEETITVTISSFEVTSSGVIVKYTVIGSTEVKSQTVKFSEVTEEMVELMKSKDIKLVIDFVNYSTAGSDTVILTAAQMKAIEYVLEYDFGIAA